MADEVEERFPYAVVVCLCVVCDQVRGDRSDEVVGSGHGAVKQEQPRGLKVGDLFEPVPETRLAIQFVSEEPLSKRWAADRRPEDDLAASFRLQVACPNGVRRPRCALQKFVKSLPVPARPSCSRSEIFPASARRRMLMDARSNHSCHLSRSAFRCDRVNVVQEREKVFSFPKRLVGVPE